MAAHTRAWRSVGTSHVFQGEGFVPNPNVERGMRGTTAAVKLQGADWLPLFTRARVEGREMLDRCLARMASELEIETPSTVEPLRVKRRASIAARMARLGPGVRITAGLLGAMARQKQRLTAVAGEEACVVALSSRRTPLSGPDVRGQLERLLRPLPGGSDAVVVTGCLRKARYLVLCEPARVSTLWQQQDALLRENVFVVDDAFLGYLLAVEMPRVRDAAVVRDRLVRRVSQTGGPDLAVQAAAATYEMAYQRLFRLLVPAAAILLTSNSFATEALRGSLLGHESCAAIWEVLHGVPTTEFEAYMAGLTQLPEAGKRQRFVGQLSGLPLYGAYVANGWDERLGINTAINRYLENRRAGVGDEGEGWLEREYKEAFRGVDADPGFVFLWMGATSHDADFGKSVAFEVEKALLRMARHELTERKIEHRILYAPHPAHARSVIESDSFFAEQGIVVKRDTVFGWLVADAAGALYSSALFEARFFGAPVFTPLRHEDGVFPPALLDRLAHPAAEDRVEAELRRFLAGSRASGRVLARAHERLRMVDGARSSVIDPTRRPRTPKVMSASR